ncbi:hypothetical protein VT84_04900 [Gemmata sp. SH-PL17]|uniref:hypothetical protein n=1 Tax=Gemmata sp. SH-PL17 TaxID=1630693 RepID=UPI00078E3D04|nr:hypothetical protein [Gemmata sp. SH-PL17]AMV23728.1 hypothetical protein VT84_04900 [Gemmata sp. SH-PL17]
MEPITLSEFTIVALRAIAHVGFAYEPTKDVCRSARWELIDDELDLGYLRYDMRPTGAPDELGSASLSIQVAESGSRPWAFVPLYYFGNYRTSREPFDRAFQILSNNLSDALGAETRSGEYTYNHRSGWPYSFVGWALADATFVLVQDEFDIQFGMDVTLWVKPAGTAVEVPVRAD